MTNQKKRALFLDRDGVINHDAGYTSSVEDFKFIDGIFELCREAIRLEFIIVVITNQAGIGRGFYSEKAFFELTSWMCEQFANNEIEISEVLYCPYHPEYGIGEYKKDSFDRKPNPGMLLKASGKFDIDMKKSIMIGDKESDMQAAQSAGIGICCQYIHGDESTPVSSAATHSIPFVIDGTNLLKLINEKQW